MRNLLLSLFVLLQINAIVAANFSLKEMETLIASENFSNADVFLSSKSFYYQYSENVMGSANKTKDFIWSLGNGDISNIDAWLILSINNYGNGPIDCLQLQLIDIGGYANILSQLNMCGYKFICTSTEHRDDSEQQKSYYSNAKYTLCACIHKENDNTIRIIELYRKGNELDEFNGTKKIKFADGTIKVSYMVKDGYLASKYISKFSKDELYFMITPNEDKWNYEVYGIFSGALFFKGTSPRKKISIFQENVIDGSGTIWKQVNDSTEAITGRVRIKIFPGTIEDGIRTLLVSVEPY